MFESYGLGFSAPRVRKIQTSIAVRLLTCKGKPGDRQGDIAVFAFAACIQVYAARQLSR